MAALFVAAVSEALLERSQEGGVERGIGRAQKNERGLSHVHLVQAMRKDSSQQ
jgi:hypothetical protein